MKPTASQTVTRRGQATAQHLGQLVKTARLARDQPRAELATRARVSPATLVRMEQGQTGIALWAWLNVFEVLGLLSLLEDLRDPATDALLRNTQPGVPRRQVGEDLDF